MAGPGAEPRQSFDNNADVLDSDDIERDSVQLLPHLDAVRGRTGPTPPLAARWAQAPSMGTVARAAALAALVAATAKACVSLLPRRSAAEGAVSTASKALLPDAGDDGGTSGASWIVSLDTGCSNWRGISLTRPLTESSEGNCRRQCESHELCYAVNWQEEECVDPTGDGLPLPRSCYLFAGPPGGGDGCEEEQNPCWELQRRPGGAALGLPEPRKRSCKNLADITLSEPIHYWSKHTCWSKCNSTQGCEAFLHEQSAPENCGKTGVGINFCVLLRAGCEEVDDPCWAIYDMEQAEGADDVEEAEGADDVEQAEGAEGADGTSGTGGGRRRRGTATAASTTASVAKAEGTDVSTSATTPVAEAVPGAPSSDTAASYCGAGACEDWPPTKKAACCSQNEKYCSCIVAPDDHDGTTGVLNMITSPVLAVSSYEAVRSAARRAISEHLGVPAEDVSVDLPSTAQACSFSEVLADTSTGSFGCASSQRMFDGKFVHDLPECRAVCVEAGAPILAFHLSSWCSCYSNCTLKRAAMDYVSHAIYYTCGEKGDQAQMRFAVAGASSGILAKLGDLDAASAEVEKQVDAALDGSGTNATITSLHQELSQAELVRRLAASEKAAALASLLVGAQLNQHAEVGNLATPSDGEECVYEDFVADTRSGEYGCDKSERVEGRFVTGSGQGIDACRATCAGLSGAEFMAWHESKWCGCYSACSFARDPADYLSHAKYYSCHKDTSVGAALVKAAMAGAAAQSPKASSATAASTSNAPAASTSSAESAPVESTTAEDTGAAMETTAEIPDIPYELVTSGQCPEPITSLSECDKAADALRAQLEDWDGNSSVDDDHVIPWIGDPPGCYFDGADQLLKVNLKNLNTGNCGGGSTSDLCICHKEGGR